MLHRTPLYIVCSPRPQVGRTLLARLLVDFFLMEQRPIAAFDLANDGPSLIDFLPDHTFRADIAGIEGQMDLFDRLIKPDRVAKVVDLPPAAFQQFFAVMREIDFVAGAHRRGIEVVALFIATPDAASARAYAALRGSLPEMRLAPVYNEAASRQAAREDFPPSRAVSLPLRIPALTPLLHRYVQQPPFCFASFRATPPDGIPLDIYIQMERWMRRAFVEFRELELRLLMSDVQASLLRGAS
jgi:hypothetical protein